MFVFRLEEKLPKRDVSDYDDEEIFAGGAQSNFGSGDDTDKETSDDSDGNGDEDDDAQEAMDYNPTFQRGGFTAADIAKLKEARLESEKDLDTTLRKYGYVPRAEYDKKEKHTRIERKEEYDDTRSTSYVISTMKKHKEREKDVQYKNGVKDKDKEKSHGMEIDDETNGPRNKPSSSIGAPTPPSSQSSASKTPSSSPPITDIPISTDIIQPQVKYQSKEKQGAMEIETDASCVDVD